MTEEIGVAEVEAFQSLDTLRRAGVITQVSLDAEGISPDLPFERFEALLALLTRFRTSAAWWIGDLVNFGEAKYGDTYAQAHEATQLSVETLSNYAWVCRSVAVKRRRPDLSFSHHEVVAALQPRAQKRWLELAAAKGWSRRELREAIGAVNEDGSPVEEDAPSGRRKLSIDDVEPIVRSIVRVAQPDGDAYRVPRDLIERLRSLCEDS